MDTFTGMVEFQPPFTTPLASVVNPSSDNKFVDKSYLIEADAFDHLTNIFVVVYGI